MKKRIASLALAGAMCAGLAVPAFAAEETITIGSLKVTGVERTATEELRYYSESLGQYLREIMTIPNATVTYVSENAEFSFGDGTEFTLLTFDEEFELPLYNDKLTREGTWTAVELGKAVHSDIEGTGNDFYLMLDDTTFICVPFSRDGYYIPDEGTFPAAYARTQSVKVDGKAVEFQCYALKDENGYETNYVKLRDVASVLNGTAAQFNVGWNGAVNIETGKAYQANGSEMSTPFSGNRPYETATAATNVNGKKANLDAFVLKDYSGSGYTYYKLRDLGKAIGFTVNWSQADGITVTTK